MIKPKMKKALKHAFEPPAPLSRERFLKTLPQPRSSRRAFILSQAGYIPLWVWGTSFATLLIAIFSACFMSRDTLGILSACIPFVASSAVAENGKSMVYRMAELEKSSLFSLKSVTLTRLGIIGFSHMLLLFLLCPLASVGGLFSILQTGIYLLVPYLLTTTLSLVFTRRFHGRETMYLCLGIAVMVSGLCIMTQSKFNLFYRQESICWWIGILIALSALTAWGYYQTIQRTEELSWSLS